jgi:hypothetical protein
MTYADFGQINLPRNRSWEEHGKTKTLPPAPNHHRPSWNRFAAALSGFFVLIQSPDRLRVNCICFCRGLSAVADDFNGDFERLSRR